MRFVVCALIVCFFAKPLRSENWPEWRGPKNNGATDEKKFPISWSPTNNVVWRLELPERGNSSPIVWKDRVFVTQAVGRKRALLCVQRRTGKILWEAGPIYDAPEMHIEEHNPYCAASPVTDGKRVIAFFGSAGVHCFDFGGRELWRADLGPITHRFGTASSPTLAGDLCIVYAGPGDRHEMVALDKRTGKIAWRAPGVPPSADEAAKVQTNGPPSGSWSTPLAIVHNNRREVVMAFAFRLGAYDLKNGALRWQTPGLGLQTYVTPLWTDGMLIAMSGTSAIALRPPANTTDAEPEVVWKDTRGKFRFGSGISAGKHLYYLAENGLAECWEKSTGKILWQERLQGLGAKKTTWSSLSMAGNVIYAPNQSGDVFVFAAEPVFRVVSTNSIAEPTNASLALANGNVLMRTDRALWCFGTDR